MVAKAFKEDFFERITNVKWTDEKRVNWICGDAQQATQSYGSKWFTSSDGKSWSENEGGGGGNGILYGFTSGLWMRQGFNPDAGGLWILGGEGATPDGMHRKAGIQISTDGVSLGETIYYDEDHFVGQFHVSGELNNGTATREDIYYDHADIWTSTDGTSWSGGPYHPDWNRSAKIIEPSGPTLMMPSKNIIPAEFALPDDIEIRGAIPIAGAQAMNRTQVLNSMRAGLRLAASPRAGNPLDERIEKYKLWDIYQLSNRQAATGTLREGKAAGKVVTIRGGTPVGWHGPGTAAYSYFKSSCTMSDAKTGKGLGKSDCGIQYGHSMAYGYYTFVCVGGDAAGNSLASHTEDGENWSVQVLNPVTPNHGGHSMWSLVVGPQPGEDTRSRS
jgi:hypothetical protein